MANLTEHQQWDDVYQLETTDPVLGGPGGVANRQAQELLNRTSYLKNAIDLIETAINSLGTGKQDADATLTALAGLATAADKMPYFTGADTASLATLTAFARTLLDDTDAATARATLGAAPLADPTFTGNPACPTPAQFDNDTSIATTAFVRRAIGSVSGTTSYSANATLTAEDVSKLIVASDGGGFTLTLPAASAVADGGSIEIFNGAGSAITVQRSGTNSIWVDTNGYSVTSISLGSGDTLRVISNGASGWILATCSVAAKYSQLFARSLTANGYQKLPGGFILQWGVVVIPAPTEIIWTYPLAFPTMCVGVYPVPVGASERVFVGQLLGKSSVALDSTPGATPCTSYVFAIGY